LGIMAAVSAVARLALELDVVLHRNCLIEETVEEPEATTTSTLLFTVEDDEDVASVAQYAPLPSLVHRAWVNGVNE